MTTPTYATGGSTPLYGTVGQAAVSGKQTMYIQKFAYDVSTFVGTTGQSVALMTIPAFSAIAYLQVIIGSAALTLSNTPSVSVGDGTSNTVYVNAASTFTANLALTQVLTTMPLKYYATADKLTLTLTAGTIFPGTGTIHFVVGVIDGSHDLAMTVQS